jgi:hypothetical protein
MFIAMSVLMRRNLSEWPTAANIAQYKNALRGGLLIEAKPIAAIAAKTASLKKSSSMIVLIF